MTEVLAQYKELKDLDSHIKDASFLWAVNHEIVDISDYSLYDQLRKKRNEITHNLLDYACKDIPKEDLELFQRMTLLYQKIDRWWINEVELPTNPEEYQLPDVDHDRVVGNQSLILSYVEKLILGDNASESSTEILKMFIRYCESN
ncbi:MAG: hypothetical protein SO135_08755 [Sphaerochaetaceae bacterium]|nr:hypothetical protein [Sphaerochaetaceae bacterium]NLY07501.1 hypothetical protein [Spirochaetales bacterium]